MLLLRTFFVSPLPVFLSLFFPTPLSLGFLGLFETTQLYTSNGASGKEHACQCRRHRGWGSIPGWQRSPGGGHGKPLQYSCLGNPRDRGFWWALVHRVTKSQIQLKWHSITDLCQPHLKDTLRGGHSISVTPAIGPVQQSLPRWTLALPAGSVQTLLLGSIFLLHSE